MDEQFNRAGISGADTTAVALNLSGANNGDFTHTSVSHTPGMFRG